MPTTDRSAGVVRDEHHSHEAAVFLDGGSVSGWVLRDLDGLLDGCQQAVAALPSQGGAEALGPTDQEAHHHVGVLFHALPCESEGRRKKRGEY